MKKLISPSHHAVMDFFIAILLLGGPWIWDFQDATMARTLSLIGGGTIATLVIFTDFPGGIVRVIPLRLHLLIDACLSIALIGLPIILKAKPGGLLIGLGLLLLGTVLFTVSATRGKGWSARC